MRFRFQEALRFSDTDALGHVNHARFLSYLEDARVAMFSASGHNLLGAQGVIVARIEIDYVKPILVDAEPVDVALWVSKIGTKSFTISYEMQHHDGVVARCQSVMVAFDYQTQQSRPLSDADKDALNAYAE